MKSEIRYSFFSAENPAGTAGSVRFGDYYVPRSSTGVNRLTPDPVVRAATEYRKAIGLGKIRAFELLKQAVLMDAAHPEVFFRNVRNAAQSILSADYRDRYEDAVQVLLLLTQDVKRLADGIPDASEEMSRAIVRALGRRKELSTLRRFVSTGSLGFREEVINAIDEIDSFEARELLLSLQSDPDQPEVIRNFLAELAQQ